MSLVHRSVNSFQYFNDCINIRRIILCSLILICCHPCTGNCFTSVYDIIIKQPDGCDCEPSEKFELPLVEGDEIIHYSELDDRMVEIDNNFFVFSEKYLFGKATTVQPKEINGRAFFDSGATFVLCSYGVCTKGINQDYYSKPPADSSLPMSLVMCADEADPSYYDLLIAGEYKKDEDAYYKDDWENDILPTFISRFIEYMGRLIKFFI